MTIKQCKQLKQNQNTNSDLVIYHGDTDSINSNAKAQTQVKPKQDETILPLKLRNKPESRGAMEYSIRPTKTNASDRRMTRTNALDSNPNPNPRSRHVLVGPMLSLGLL